MNRWECLRLQGRTAGRVFAAVLLSSLALTIAIESKDLLRGRHAGKISNGTTVTLPSRTAEISAGAAFPAKPRQVRRAGAGLKPAATPRFVRSYGALPLSFEANVAQTDGQDKFLSRGSGYTLLLTANEAVLALRKPSAISGQASAIGKPKTEIGNWRGASRPWSFVPGPLLRAPHEPGPDSIANRQSPIEYSPEPPVPNPDLSSA